METDITVRGSDRTLLIDTKYYSKTLSSYFGSQSIHSSNLYQLFSYLKNMEVRDYPDRCAEGMLLYPKTSENVDLNYDIQGHKVGVRTVDLSLHWTEVSRRIRSIIQSVMPAKISA